MMAVKREEEIELASAISPFAGQIASSSFELSGIFDFDGGAASGGSRSFMELLGIGDFPQSMYDFPPLAEESMTAAATPALESSDTVNFPATPNCSSISSSSAEEINDTKCAVNNEERQKIKSKVTTSKKGQKRTREPRFAFVTKSEVDHLEDGYRWRKYGQKAVKNSPFPRSYYRCTSAACLVKKRVERSSADRTVVVTTYEGQHTHPSPVGPRGGGGYIPPPLANSSSAFVAQPAMNQPSPYVRSLLPPQQMNFYQSNARFIATDDQRFCNDGASLASAGQSPMIDNGLLQDVIWPIRSKDGGGGEFL